MEPLLKEFETLTFSHWEKEAESTLEGKPLSRLTSSTYEQIPVQPLYTSESINSSFINNEIPGSFPYLRGTRADGYKTRKWKIAQDIKVPSPADFNEIARQAVQKGVNSLNMHINTLLLGMGSESEETIGTLPVDVNGENSGKLDIATYCNTAEDFAQCFENINLNDININIYAASYALMVLPVILEGLKSSEIRGTISFDPIASLMLDGSINGPVDSTHFELESIYKFCRKNLPHFKPFRLDAYIYREAGANAVQELAFSFTSAIEYIRELIKRGYEIDELAPKFCFEFSACPNFFMEIAKFRAARVIWANIISSFGGNEESCKLNFSARVINNNKSTLDRHVNILRNTTEAFAAVLGGAESIVTLPFDENLKPADEFSRRIARNTQHVLQDECNLTDVNDPAGGSYFIESLTSQIADKVWSLIQEIENQGGMFASVLGGYPQSLTNTTAKAIKSDISTRKETLLGTNKQANQGEEIKSLLDEVYIDIAEQSVKQVVSLLDKIEHDEEIPILQKLNELSAAKDLSLVDLLSRAVKDGAAVIDLVDSIRTSDETIQAAQIYSFRTSEEFEELRLNAEKFKEINGNYPSIFLAAFGSPKQYKGRVDFTREFFSVGGFTSIFTKSFTDSEEALPAFAESRSKICLLCSSDEMYEEIVPVFAKRFKEQFNDSMLILAGFPPEKTEEYKAAGIDDFIHVKANILDIMTKVQKFLSMDKEESEAIND